MIPRKDLNSRQYEAVTTITGPVLVIAGAGSGKTRTLIYRLAHLIDTGVPPDSILLLTFTRKAAQEMMFRASHLLDDSCQGVVGGTFHAVANMLLRRYGSHLGFQSSFTIIDQADSEGIINLLKSSLDLSGKGKQFPTKRVLRNIISGSVNKSKEIDDLVFEQYGHLSEHIDDIISLQKHYQEFKINHGLMDYDDLLVNWKRLLKDVPQAREEISQRFSHIMVDEYQDTNLIQADIITLMAKSHKNVMVVGDDSQSIYSFRGADFYNIMRFPKVFANTRIVKLEENYRSTQPILELTNDIIRNASEKYTKRLYSNIEGELRPAVYGGGDEQNEAAFVVNKIKNCQEEGVALEDIAVLFRSGFHSYKLEMALTAAGFDFEKRGGLKLTESAHIKDVLAFLRVVVNPGDTLSWNRIFLQIDRVGPKTAQKITDAIAAQDDPFAALACYKPGASWREGFKQLTTLMKSLQETDSPPSLFELIMHYYEPLFESIYHDDYPRRKRELEQLKGIMSSYDSLQAFIDDTTLDPPESEISQQAAKERLILSTIHSAKGLEWDVVFVIGLAEGRFPHIAAMGNQREEERRLFYVAATRAKKELYLCYPREVIGSDRRFMRVGKSPFLQELNRALYRELGGEKYSGSRYRMTDERAAGNETSFTGKLGRQAKLSISDFTVGTKVNHPFFGEGEVKKIKKPSTLDIHFFRHGLKTLHLNYAKLAILS